MPVRKTTTERALANIITADSLVVIPSFDLMYRDYDYWKKMSGSGLQGLARLACIFALRHSETTRNSYHSAMQELPVNLTPMAYLTRRYALSLAIRTLFEADQPSDSGINILIPPSAGQSPDTSTTIRPDLEETLIKTNVDPATFVITGNGDTFLRLTAIRLIEDKDNFDPEHKQWYFNTEHMYYLDAQPMDDPAEIQFTAYLSRYVEGALLSTIYPT
jgi:hypothetical protein